MKKILVFLLAAALLLCFGCAARGTSANETYTGAGIPTDGSSLTDRLSAAAEEAGLGDQADGDVFYFSTTDLDGNAVDSADLFSQSALTMVNFWGTYCPPCIAEMPELAELAEEMTDENVAVVGVVVDVDETAVDEAWDILLAANAGYLNLLPASEMFQQVDVMYIPTTILVDPAGHIVGDPIIGANEKDTYAQAISAALETLS